jgi:DNA polymerase I
MKSLVLVSAAEPPKPAPNSFLGNGVCQQYLARSTHSPYHEGMPTLKTIRDIAATQPLLPDMADPEQDPGSLGIVSVWAEHNGQILIWRRIDEEITIERGRFRPWLFAADLEDLAHLGSAMRAADPDAPFSFEQLDGPEDCYRYLVSARDGRALERAILTGAAQRRETAPRDLNDLDAYLRLRPVDQYLLSSRRTYFRGLRYTDLLRMQFDLETTSLDPQQGRIIMAAVRDSRGLDTVLEAATPADEAGLIGQLCRLIRERDPDVIENHNLFGFDLPFLEARAELLGVRLQLARAGAPERLIRFGAGRDTRYRIPGRELLDTLDAVRRHDFVARDMPSHRLKDVARYFGVATPDRVYLAGAEIASIYTDRPDLARRYARDDVAEVDALSQRLHSAPFALAQIAPRRYERVAYAGPAMGILEPMLLRAYLHRRAAPPMRVDHGSPDGLRHTGGALYLFAEGVARQVVKADIASLYPSIMRSFRIGPAPDRIGALLAIVDHLLTARLQHKAAARRAAPGSLEAGHHAALQAAMKLIINSAYGYMGATNMARFADMAAADEVTRRGRELLQQVIDGLRRRGVALIEADTDGVYFAVPASWTEADERALVAEVDGELPSGIQLEYEGRYAAMFSHEVKNYALLGYDGELTLRGVALRSSRNEPFGERFLREAIRLTMTGDCNGLRDRFQETAGALRARRIPLDDIAIRARLRKTPEQYRSTRQREGAYEAVLNSGRTTWRVGEAIRFYRATGGQYHLLPEPGRPGPDYDVEHYLRILIDNYAGRLRKAFHPDDFAQIFRGDGQIGLFDRDLARIEPRWIEPG